MKEELIEVVHYHINNRMILNIERKDISEGAKITGFPIALTNDYLFMTNIYDFHDEGYVLVKTEDITDAYSNTGEMFYESICVQERLQEKILVCPLEIVCDIKSFIEAFKNNRYLTFHCEREIEKCNFFLGKVKHIANTFVEQYSHGADGKWDNKTETIYFSDITMIAFDDYYAKMYYKYVEIERK